MPIEDRNFVETYRARDDLAERIADPAAGGFFRSYALWIERERIPDFLSIVTLFGGFRRIEAALAAGDGAEGRSAGEVLRQDVAALREVVLKGRDQYASMVRRAAGAAAETMVSETQFPDLSEFDAALRLFFGADVDLAAEENQLARGLLNGTVLLRTEVPDPIDPRRKGEFLQVIPGTVVLQFERDLQDPFWRSVADRVHDACTTFSNPFNITEAAQLRLAPDDPLSEPAPDVVLGGV